MQLWNDFLAWFTSSDAQPVLYIGAVVFVAIIVSGLLSAWIARGAIRGLLTRSEREQKAAAVAALVDAAVEASVWNSLTPAEQVLSDRSVGQADIMVRLLPVKGAGVAADWVAHQLGELKRNSATYGYNLEPAIVEFRDRLVEWQNRPRRTRKLFLEDLQRWRFERTTGTEDAYSEQDAWVAREHHDRHASPMDALPQTTSTVEGADADVSATPASRTDDTTADTVALDGYDAPAPVGAYASREATGLRSD